MAEGAQTTEVEVRIAGPKAEAERVMGLLRRAQEGDASVVLELRKVLDQQPALWRSAGDLARVTEQTWVQRIAGQQLYSRESIGRRLRELRRDLLGEAPTPLARLLIDRVVCTWLGLQFAETHHARTMSTQTYDQGAYYQERIVRYQKLHLAAIKALATLRKLEQRGPLVAVGVGQLNVAEQQVNVAAPAVAAERTTASE